MADPDDALDAECEEWVGWLNLPPKRVIHARGIVRRIVPILQIDLEIDARVEALARAHEPTTGATPLTRKEVRALLDEGKRIRREVEARVDAMERIPEADRAKRCR